MSERRLELGRRGEAAATAYLQKRGHVIVASNWRGPGGELDLITRDGRWLVVVEVRTRRGATFGSAAESIHGRKRRRLLTLGAAFVQQAGWTGPWRVDVVTITVADGEVGRAHLVHYANAVRP